MINLFRKRPARDLIAKINVDEFNPAGNPEFDAFCVGHGFGAYFGDGGYADLGACENVRRKAKAAFVGSEIRQAFAALERDGYARLLSYGSRVVGGDMIVCVRYREMSVRDVFVKIVRVNGSGISYSLKVYPVTWGEERLYPERDYAELQAAKMSSCPDVVEINELREAVPNLQIGRGESDDFRMYFRAAANS